MGIFTMAYSALEWAFQAAQRIFDLAGGLPLAVQQLLFMFISIKAIPLLTAILEYGYKIFEWLITKIE